MSYHDASLEQDPLTLLAEHPELRLPLRNIRQHAPISLPSTTHSRSTYTSQSSTRTPRSSPPLERRPRFLSVDPDGTAYVLHSRRPLNDWALDFDLSIDVTDEARAQSLSKLPDQKADFQQSASPSRQVYGGIEIATALAASTEQMGTILFKNETEKDSFKRRLDEISHRYSGLRDRRAAEQFEEVLALQFHLEQAKLEAQAHLTVQQVQSEANQPQQEVECLQREVERLQKEGEKLQQELKQLKLEETMPDTVYKRVRQELDLKQAMEEVQAWQEARSSGALTTSLAPPPSPKISQYGRPSDSGHSPISEPQTPGGQLPHLPQDALAPEPSDATAFPQQLVIRNFDHSTSAGASLMPDFCASSSSPRSLTSDSGTTSTSTSLETGVEPYRHVDTILISRASSQTLRQWLHQAEIDGIFTRGAAYRSRAPATAQATASGSHRDFRHGSAKSPAAASRSDRKRMREDGNNNSHHSDEDDTNRRRRQKVSHQSGDEPDGLLFDCPYHKHDPQRYSEKNGNEMAYRGCASSCLKNINRVKQHLYRVHQKPQYHCRRCYLVFTDGLALETHSRLDPPCAVSNQARYSEQMTDDQYRQIKQKHPRKTPEEKWFLIYEILWPGELPPASPYIESDAQGVVQHFLDFMRRDAPELIERELRQAGHHVSEELTLIASSQVREAAIPQVLEIYAVRRNLNQPVAAEANYAVVNAAPSNAGDFPADQTTADQPVGTASYGTNSDVPRWVPEPLNPILEPPSQARANLPVAHQDHPLPSDWATDWHKPFDSLLRYDPDGFDWNLDDLA